LTGLSTRKRCSRLKRMIKWTKTNASALGGSVTP
jgi:hypothetical protein